MNSGASEFAPYPSAQAGDILAQYLPYVIAALVIFILLVIFLMIYKPFARNKMKHIRPSGMTMGDIEKMRKEGLVSEEEYRKIRRKMSEREVGEVRAKANTEMQKALLDQAKVDPEAARQLWTPEELAQIEARQAAAGTKPAAPAQSSRERPTLRPVEPSMNMPRVAQERRRAEAPNQAGAPSQPGELDLLLQKGAISPEEYERLKKFVK
jgi:uncharacterized membrane protein